ncbi:MAG TPA: PQQ-binding-like beta-propeller repeat protein [Verrucomicrobiae bacterium]|nr:PQQ-binding-like beta-propeller repeat protein [Verrucomicrobiae bacterium]
MNRRNLSTVGCIGTAIVLGLFAPIAPAAPGDLRWEKSLGDCVIGSPALATNGDLLVGTCGALHAISPAGSNRWSFFTGINVLGTVVAADGTIYVGSDKLYALNPDGSKRWEFALEAYSSWYIYAQDPVLGPDGAIYVMRPFAPNGEERLYAINSDGTLRWKLNGNFVGAGVVAADGAILVSSGYGGSFACINPDGVLRWNASLGSGIQAGAAIADNGTMLVPVNDSSGGGAVQALTAAGGLGWRFEGGAQANNSPVIGPDGKGYCAFDNGRVVALNTNGSLLWQYTMPGTNVYDRIGGTPALAADGTLFFVGEQFLHALDAQGQLLWRFTGGTNKLESPLIGSDGTIYVGDLAGKLFAVEGNGAGLATGQWPMARRNARHQASQEFALSPPAAPTGVTASLSNHTDKVIITWASVPTASHYVVWRSLTPSLVDAVELTDSATGKMNFDDRSAVPGASYFYFVQARNVAGRSTPVGPVFGARGVAVAGQPVWIYPTEGSASTPAIGLDGAVVFCSSDGNLYAVDPNGQAKWKFPFGGASFSVPSIAHDGTIYFSAAISRYPKPETNAIFAVTAAGQLRWRVLTESPLKSGIAIGSDGTLYTATGNNFSPQMSGIRALTPQGSNLWTFANGRNFTTTPLLGADGTIYASSSDGRLHALSPAGTLLWVCENAGTPRVIGGNGEVFTEDASFHAVNPDGQKLWDYALQYGADFGPSCLDSAGVVYAQGDYTYYRFGANGAGVTRFTLPESLDRTLAPVARDAAGTVYASVYHGVYSDALTGKIYAMSAAGAKQWEYSLLRVSFGGATLVTNNTLYVPGSDGMYALRTAAGPDTSAWPHALHDAQCTARADQLPPIPPAPIPTATFRSRVTDVRISWNSILGASSYQIFRATTANPMDAVLLAEVTGTLLFDDGTAIPEMGYTYWVKARNASGTSPFNAGANGMRRQAVAGELLYEWNLYGEIDTSPALASDGTIYVSVNQPLFGSPDAGRKVVALGTNGTIRWEYLTGQGLLSSPMVDAAGKIYVGTRSSIYPSGFSSPLLALHPDGTLAWQFIAEATIITTPVLGQDGTIFFGSEAGTLYALTPTGQLKWSLYLTNGIGAIAAGRDGTLYAFSGAKVMAVRGDGSFLWSANSGGDSIMPVALDQAGNILVACGTQGVKAFNPDGTLRWQNSTSGTFYSTPVVGTNGSIILGATGGPFRFFDSNGVNTWSTNSGGSHYSAAAVSSHGVVYAGNSAGKLIATSHSASKLWEHNAGSAVRSSPTIAPDGTIYVGTLGGKLISVFGDGELAATSWPMFQHDAQHQGRDLSPAVLPAIVTNVAASDGSFNDRVRVSWTSAAGAGSYEVWRHTLNDSNGAILIAPSVATQTMFDDQAAVPGTNYFYWVRAANGVGTNVFSQADSGFRRIAIPGELIGDSRPINATASSAAVGANEIIYAGGSGRLYALNPDLSKAREFAQGSVSTPAIDSFDNVLFWSSNQRFYSLDGVGDVDWSLSGPPALSLPAALALDDSPIIADNDRKVSNYDPQTGLWRWQYLASSPITAPPAVAADGTIFFGTQDGQLHSLRPDGTLRWRFRVNARIQSSPAVGTDGVVYFGADDRGIYAVETDGRRKWVAQASDMVKASPVIAPDGTIIVGSLDRRLYAFGPDGTKRWDFLAESAIYSSACVGSDGVIYFGTYNGWVYALDRDGKRVWAFNSATNAVSGRVLESPLLLEDRLLVPIYSVAIQAFAVTAGSAEVNWPQYRHDARRTSRAKSWLNFAMSSAPSGLVAGESFWITVDFSYPQRTIARIELLAGANVVATATATNRVLWTGMAGNHLMGLRLVDDLGNVHFAPTQNLVVHPAPRIVMTSPASGTWQFTFDTVPGRQYQMERSTNLSNWLPAGPVWTATNSSQTWIESGPTGAAAYYRVKIAP